MLNYVQIVHLNHLKYKSQIACIHHLQINGCCRHCERIDCEEEKVWMVEIQVIVSRDKVDHHGLSLLVNFQELVIVKGVAPAWHGHGHV